MKGVSLLGNVPLYFIYVVIGFFLLDRREAFSFIGIIVSSGIINEGIKIIFDIPRPPSELYLISVVGAGFPSGHAQMAVVVWGWLGYKFNKLKPAIIIIFLIGLSRMYLGVHYPYQVISGWVIGLVILVLWVRRFDDYTEESKIKDDYKKVADSYDKKIEPLVHAIREIVVNRIIALDAKNVLDMCCGTGKQLSMIPESIDRYGIDNSPSMLSIAESRNLPNCILGEANKTPYADFTFDIVLSQLALHEKSFQVIQSELDEVKRILKPSGTFIIVDFTQPTQKDLMGFMFKFIIKQIERFAGKEHFAHYKNWMENGGLIPILESMGWTLTRTKDFYSGTVQLAEFSYK